MEDTTDKLAKARSKYHKTGKGRETRRKYRDSKQGKEAQRRYLSSERGMIAQLRYYLSEKGYKARQRQNELRKLLTQCANFLEAHPDKTISDFLTTLDKDYPSGKTSKGGSNVP